MNIEHIEKSTLRTNRTQTELLASKGGVSDENPASPPKAASSSNNEGALSGYGLSVGSITRNLSYLLIVHHKPNASSSS